MLKTTLFFLPLALLVASVNYYGDAAGLFDNNIEKEMVKIIKDGYHVTNIHKDGRSNYNVRFFQRELIKNCSSKPDIMVLGSSKTMLINTDCFNGQTVMNNSVSGGSVEDMLAIYQMHKENGSLPKKALIGIAPWLFNANNNQKRWRLFKNEYNRFHNAETSKFDGYFKYGQLLSCSYFQSSIKNLPTALSRKGAPTPTDEKYNEELTRLADGSLIYGREYREKHPGEIQEQVITQAKGRRIYSVENFSEISRKSWQEFSSLLNRLKSDGVAIAFILTPYHPIFYEKIKADYPMVLETEKMILELARRENFTTYGSFDPSKLGLDGSYFYDSMHCNEEGTSKILANINRPH